MWYFFGGEAPEGPLASVTSAIPAFATTLATSVLPVESVKATQQAMETVEGFQIRDEFRPRAAHVVPYAVKAAPPTSVQDWVSKSIISDDKMQNELLEGLHETIQNSRRPCLR